jgi:hypothetical protein
VAEETVSKEIAYYYPNPMWDSGDWVKNLILETRPCPRKRGWQVDPDTPEGSLVGPCSAIADFAILRSEDGC